MSEIEVFYSLMVIVFSVVAIAIGVITAREVIRKIKRGLTQRANDYHTIWCGFCNTERPKTPPNKRCTRHETGFGKI